MNVSTTAAVRPTLPIRMPDIIPAEVNSPEPEFRWIDPTSLLIDGGYQRSLSERSVNLIRRIVSRWDWARFKPPVVAETPAGLEVIDGQHTAIAAASHPGISKIPVMVVFAPMQTTRALAFVGHNRDRLGITPAQLFYANLAAGDEDAQTTQQVCERAGVRILRGPPGGAQFKPGDTMAVVAIHALISRRGAMNARIVLQTIADAHCAPVSFGQIKAVETLLHESEFKGQISAADVTTALMRLGAEADQQARVFAAAHSVKVWRALAIVLFKEGRRGRRRAA